VRYSHDALRPDIGEFFEYSSRSNPIMSGAKSLAYSRTAGRRMSNVLAFRMKESEREESKNTQDAVAWFRKCENSNYYIIVTRQSSRINRRNVISAPTTHARARYEKRFAYAKITSPRRNR